MNARLNKCWCILFGLALALGLGLNTTASAQCSLSFGPPTGNTLTSFVSIFENYPNSDANFDFQVGPGQPLQAGHYLGWCVDADTFIDPGQNYTITGTTYTGALFPTCDPNLNSELPPNHPASCYVSPAVWQQVNYILNHKNGAYFWDVEVAINNLVGGPPPPSPPYPPFTQANVDGLLQAASNNAASWTPQCGDVVGAIYVITNADGSALSAPVQLLMIEVPICPTTFTQCATNMDLGCNPAPSSIPSAPYTTYINLVSATNCCGHPLTITVTPSQATVGCQTTLILTYTATDGFGNTATCAQTITWTTDTTAPKLTVPPGGDLGCSPAHIPTTNDIITASMASDDCSGTATITVTASPDVTTPCGVTRSFLVTASDTCGNKISKPVVYTWETANAAPTITVPTGSDLGCNPKTLPTTNSVLAQVTVSNTCGNAAVIISVVSSTNNCRVTNTFSVYAVGPCGAASPVKTVVYTWTADTTPPVINCPPTYILSNSAPNYCTYTCGDYSSSCTGSNASSILNNCWKKIYSGGYTLCGSSSGGNCLKFTSFSCIQNFVNCSGTPNCLKSSYTNPSKCEAGSFAGQVLCLKLNVDLGDNCGASGFGAGCGDLVLNDPTCPLNGLRIRDILTICHTALCGGDVSKYGCNIGTLSTVCSNLNQCYQGSAPSTWCRGHVIPPTITNVPPSVSGTATVVDKCTGTPTLTYSDVWTAGACADTYSIARTWVAVDSCGNSNYCVQTILVGNTAASVCGFVFQDCNGDGYLTAGIDSGLSNVVVTLKNGNGVVVATNFTDGTGAYCFYNLTPGTYTVAITAPSTCVQTAGTHTNHWIDTNNNQCWYENDGYQHCKGGDGVDRWTANDGCSHYRSGNLDCWKDSRGSSHSQNCTYTSCDTPKNNAETFTLAACESKSSVNFAYQGQSGKATVCVSGPSKGVCGQTLTYTCTISNNGSACFTSCKVTACGNSYTCPNLGPGQCYSFPVTHTCSYGDFGGYQCQANAYCGYNSSNCSASSSCNTSVGFW